MATKTTKKIIKDTLANLTRDNFADFCDQLLEHGVKRNKVEGKSYLDIAQVLVSTFTESRAAGVVEEILREIDCHGDADKLVEEVGGQTSKPGASDNARPSAGATGVNTVAEGGCTGADFVDKHRGELIDRVDEIAPILDELLGKGIIQQERYSEIMAIPTNRDKMRRLFSGPLHAAGREGKDVFYMVLEEKEKYLIADLKKKK